MVNFHTKTSLELLLENSPESVILTIDDEKSRSAVRTSVGLHGH